MTHSIMTLGIATLGIMYVIVAFTISIECHYAASFIIVVLSVVMFNLVKLGV
jgi:hypothetical protein